MLSGDGAWIDGESNALGIQGAFVLFEDGTQDGVVLDDGLIHTDFDPDSGGTGSEEPSAFDVATLRPCISGTAATVTAADGLSCVDDCLKCAFHELFGGGIGLNLRETGGDDSKQ